MAPRCQEWVQQRWEWGRHGRVAGLLGLFAMGSGVPVAAQATYTVFPAKARAAAAQPTRPGTGGHVSLVVQDSTLDYVVRTLADQAHLHPFYDYKNPVFAKRVTVNVANANVMDAFAVVLRGTGLVAKLWSDNATLLIGAPSGMSPAARARLAGGVVVGRVTDSASGAGLGGATVRVAGTKLSTVTSDSGQFTLKDVPLGDHVLMVRLFGFRPAERPVTVVDSQQTIVRIVMVPVPTVLSGVVTTATGLQRKVEVGNDITSLNVDSIRQVAPISSVTDLLETRVPGLTVLHSSGTPGDPSRIRLRGAGSMQLNNDPIVIVDGVRVYASQSDVRNQNLAPSLSASGQRAQAGTNALGQGSLQRSSNGYTAPSPLDQIDPASIETIEVLKGPSATATYGSDAAGGVIVITTKHGRAGPTQWSLGLADGVNWSPGSWPTNYYRFGYDASGVTGISGFCQWYNKCTVDSVVAFQALNDPRYTVFSQGRDQQANLTVSGGLPTLTYSLTGSGAGNVGLLKLPGIDQQWYDSVHGPIPGYLLRPDNYTTWGAGGSLTALPSSTVRVTLSSSLYNSVQQQSSLNNGVIELEAAYVPPTLLTGPLISNDLERAVANSTNSTNAVTVHWQARPWLPLDATGGLNSLQRSDNTYLPYGIPPCAKGSVFRVDNTGSSISCVSSDTTGYYGVGRGTSRDQTLTVGTAIPLRLMTLALGGNLHNGSTADFSVSTQLLAPGETVPNGFFQANGVPSPASSSTTSQSTYGWYVEPRLNFASRFFVSPGFRLDGGSGGSTSSGSVGGLSAFPKVDFSYVAVDRQGGHPLWGVLTLLRPRVALGLAGNQPPPQDKLRLFNVGVGLPTAGNTVTVPGLGAVGDACTPSLTLNGGASAVPVVCLNALGNTQLRPERTRDLEGGLDATLWRGRLSLTYTQYTKQTQDAIQAIPVATSVAGGWAIQKNIGTIRNTGTDITVNAAVLESRALSWNVGAVISNTNSLVVRLNPGQNPICLGSSSGFGSPCVGTRIVAGYPLFGLWQQPIVAFADANHDGLIEASEIRFGDSAVYVGQPNPKYQANLNTGVTLFNGRLSVNATFQYQNGLTQDNAAACQSNTFSLLPNNPSTPLATQAAIVAAECGQFPPSLIGAFGTQNTIDRIGLIQTVNTFRFNALSINYNVPRAVSAWVRVPRMSVALQGSNLALHTNYRGIDPNVNAFSTVSAGDETADLGQLPLPRTWWLRMTLGN